MEFFERLDKLLAELKLVNNSDLAEELGINRQYISNLRIIISTGILKSLIEHFDKDSPLDQFK